ncbi:hypothetical protein FPQ18DRAFT_381488, partial [Pyronema domesticum]
MPKIWISIFSFVMKHPVISSDRTRSAASITSTEPIHLQTLPEHTHPNYSLPQATLTNDPFASAPEIVPSSPNDHAPEHLTGVNVPKYYLPPRGAYDSELPEVPYHEQFPEALHPGDSHVSADRRNKICGMSRRIFWILTIAGTIIIIAAIGGGVAAVVNSKKAEKLPAVKIRSPNAPRNGTEIGIAQWGLGEKSSNSYYHIFYQSISGEIWERSYTPTGGWAASSTMLGDAFKARNGTPICGFAYKDKKDTLE